MFQSPQWGSNSKVDTKTRDELLGHESFSPRNGEVILKLAKVAAYIPREAFQSPQWGSNSKDGTLL